jgi:8-oxo-dGTP diphosphatase
MERKITTRGVVLHNGKLLCVKLNQYKGAMPGAGGYWCIPGGKLEAGESVIDGVKREMFEETGVEPVVGNLLYVQQFEHNGVEFIEFFFHVTNSEDYLDIDLAKSSHGIEEIAEIDFIDPAQHNVKPLFFSHESLQEDAAKGVTKFFANL